jgi:thiol:disulfide interchange protein
MPVQKIANLDEFKALLAKPGLVVVDFTAAWCKFAVARSMGAAVFQ